MRDTNVIFKEEIREQQANTSSLVNIFCQANNHLFGPFPPSTYYPFEKKKKNFEGSLLKRIVLKIMAFSEEKIILDYISVDITNSGAFHSNLDPFFLPHFPCFSKSLGVASKLKCCNILNLQYCVYWNYYHQYCTEETV